LRNKKWKWKTLGELCNDVEYGTSAKSTKEGRIPVLRMGNIQDGKLVWNNLVYTDDKDEIKKYLLKPNDVLFNRTNSPELVGKTAIYRGEMPAIFAGYLIRIHRKEDLLDADFLTYFLNSQIAFDYGKTVVISSVNQANINGTKLKGYDVLAYIAFALSPITREERVSTRRARIFSHYDDDRLRAFLDFVLSEYVKEGVGELDQAKLTPLLELKYRAVSDAARDLGGIARIRETFVGFQKYLYANVGARTVGS
jgi:hypothetical protein